MFDRVFAPLVSRHSITRSREHKILFARLIGPERPALRTEGAGTARHTLRLFCHGELRSTAMATSCYGHWLPRSTIRLSATLRGRRGCLGPNKFRGAFPRDGIGWHAVRPTFRTIRPASFHPAVIACKAPLPSRAATPSPCHDHTPRSAAVITPVDQKITHFAPPPPTPAGWRGGARGRSPPPARRPHRPAGSPPPAAAGAPSSAPAPSRRPRCRPPPA